MSRVYNFGAGPAMLPVEVLQRAQEELLDWNGSGMSVFEVSHRSKGFQEMMATAELDLRDLLAVPANYQILFLTAPARAQSAMVPMNLLRGKTTADYLDTGTWSYMALQEGRRFCEAKVVCSSRENAYTTIPEVATWQLNPEAAFVHYCANETIHGIEFHDVPETGQVPLVTDMTSSFLSQPIDIAKYGLIYAGAQKNVGPAGLTIVIVREDLIGAASSTTPIVYDYKTQQENSSLYYTPASFSYYMAAIMFQWIKKQGGLVQMAERNQRKAEKLYAYIDSSDFYHSPVAHKDRSRMNVPFILADNTPDNTLDALFLREAQAAGLSQLKGHRLVGGMRASLYNAMPEAGVDALITLMQDFVTRNG